MRWLWFVGSLLCFVVVFKTTSIGLALLCLLGALVFMLIGTLAVAAQRIESRRGDATRLLGPDEIRQMREVEMRSKGAKSTTVKKDPEIVGLTSAAAMIAGEASRREPGSTASANEVQNENNQENLK